MKDTIRCHDGQIQLNLEYFTHHNSGVEMTWDAGEPVVGASDAGDAIIPSGTAWRPPLRRGP